MPPLFIAVAGAGAYLGLRTVGVTIEAGPFRGKMIFLVGIIASGLFFRFLGTRYLPRSKWPFIVSDCCISYVQLVGAVLVLLPLSYLAVAAGFPLRDAILERYDELLFGFDWASASDWVKNHPNISSVLNKAYFTLTIQSAIILLLGSKRSPGTYNREFFWLFSSSLAIVTLIFIFTPALGKIGHLGTDQVETILAIRSGQWNKFDYSRGVGLINFPSFHATLAIIFVYAVRASRLALCIFVPLNILMLIATIPVGGHYLLDLPAGIAVSFAAILITRRITASQMSLSVSEAGPGEYSAVAAVGVPHTRKSGEREISANN